MALTNFQNVEIEVLDIFVIMSVRNRTFFEHPINYTVVISGIIKNLVDVRLRYNYYKHKLILH